MVGFKLMIVLCPMSLEISVDSAKFSSSLKFLKVSSCSLPDHLYWSTVFEKTEIINFLDHVMHTFSVFNPVYDIVKHVASWGYSMKFIDHICILYESAFC